MGLGGDRGSPANDVIGVGNCKPDFCDFILSFVYAIFTFNHFVLFCVFFSDF